DLCLEWFAGAATVGITAGTSTPDALIDSVERAIREMTAHPLEGSSHPDNSFELNAA
ncbi:MAG: hypothetical protein DME23_26035, partial [Verrucomicrobia bacterium]